MLFRDCLGIPRQWVLSCLILWHYWAFWVATDTSLSSVWIMTPFFLYKEISLWLSNVYVFNVQTSFSIWIAEDTTWSFFKVGKIAQGLDFEAIAWRHGRMDPSSNDKSAKNSRYHSITASSLERSTEFFFSLGSTGVLDHWTGLLLELKVKFQIIPIWDEIIFLECAKSCLGLSPRGTIGGQRN